LSEHPKRFLPPFSALSERGGGMHKKRKRLLYAGIGGADRSALGFVKVAFALDALAGVDHVVLVALGDGAGRADRFASAATDTRIING
jgi:hypothetical protein